MFDIFNFFNMVVDIFGFKKPHYFDDLDFYIRKTVKLKE